MLAAAPETMALQDTDEWWRERRILARKLLDLGKFQTAYEVVRDGRPARQAKITGRISISCRDGSPCAISTIPQPRARISPISTMDRPIRSCWRGRTTGEAAPPRRSEITTPCAPATKPPRAITPPITDSSRAPNSALKELSCARRCRPIRPAMLRYRTKSCAPPTCSMRSASATWWSVLRLISRKTAATCRRWPRLASWPSAATMRGPCCSSERRRSPAASRSILTPSRPSASRSTARSVPKSNAASSIRWRAPKARSTSATSRRPTRSA